MRDKGRKGPEEAVGEAEGSLHERTGRAAMDVIRRGLRVI